MIQHHNLSQPFMMKTGVLYGQRFSQERLPENSNSFQNCIVCFQQQVFSASILPEQTFQGQYGKLLECRNRHNHPWTLWDLVRTFMVIPCGLPCNTACRSVQCSCSKAELCCTKFCWCEGNMKYASILQLFRPVLMILIRRRWRWILAELNKTPKKLATLVSLHYITLHYIIVISNATYT